MTDKTPTKPATVSREDYETVLGCYNKCEADRLELIAALADAVTWLDRCGNRLADKAVTDRAVTLGEVLKSPGSLMAGVRGFAQRVADLLAGYTLPAAARESAPVRALHREAEALLAGGIPDSETETLRKRVKALEAELADARSEIEMRISDPSETEA